MAANKFDYLTTKILRNFRATDSALMEQFDLIDKQLNYIDKLREQPGNERQLRKAERHLEIHWSRLKRGMLKYQNQRADHKESVDTQFEIQAHNAEVAAETAAEGNSLTSKLGMALFAWKTSNAFDDLAKLSGRK